MKCTKEDWKAAADMICAEWRARLGPPPTFEEMEDYFAGKLSDEAADRMREFLVAYPDMTRAMVAEFPSEEEAAAVLTDEEVAEDWQKILKRVQGEPC